MHFAHPEMLNSLWLVIPVGMVFWLLLSRKRQKIKKFAEAHLLDNLMKGFSYPRFYFKFILFALTFVFAVIALARPQWGFEWQEIKRQGIDIFVVIDTSKSMLTTDIKPNRLERTKLALQDLVRKLQGDRIGLIAFAGDAFVMCPLTVDYNGFLMTLDDLGVDSIPRGGTNVGRAIEEAIKSYDNTPSRHRAVIILTDGENLEGDPLRSAQEAQKKGIKLFTIGIGTQEGELIQVENEQGEKGFVKDEQGNFIKSRLNEDLLQKIAVATGGVYVRASGAQFGLELIYDRELSKMEKRDFESKKEKRYFERFQVPLAVAFLLLIVESFLSPRVRVRMAVALVFLAYMGASPAWAGMLAKDVNDANRLYQEKDYEGAIKKYEQALGREPNSDIINFNQGTALYRLKKYPQALEHLQKSLLTDDPMLKQKALFNIANTHYRIGMQHEDTDYDKAIQHVERALQEVNKALELDKDDKDAQHNRDFFESELRRLKRDKQSFGNQQKEEQKKKQQPQKDQPSSAERSQGDGSSAEPSADDPSAGADKNQPQPPLEQAGGQREDQAGSSDPAQEMGVEEIKDDDKMDTALPAQREKLSAQEAQRLLEQYQAGEEPGRMLHFGQRPAADTPVLKDW